MPFECAIAASIITREYAFEYMELELEDGYVGIHVNNKKVVKIYKMIGLKEIARIKDVKGEYIAMELSKVDFEINKIKVVEFNRIIKMKAFIFPGQGCQKEGMGHDLYKKFSEARDLFENANEVLGRKITDVMFHGTELELMETKNTQPSVFLYEVVLAKTQHELCPDVVAGHSLGEFAALVIAGAITFEDGLNLVLNRAIIGQKACEKDRESGYGCNNRSI